MDSLKKPEQLCEEVITWSSLLRRSSESGNKSLVCHGLMKSQESEPTWKKGNVSCIPRKIIENLIIVSLHRRTTLRNIYTMDNVL